MLPEWSEASGSFVWPKLKLQVEEVGGISRIVVTAAVNIDAGTVIPCIGRSILLPAGRQKGSDELVLGRSAALAATGAYALPYVVTLASAAFGGVAQQSTHDKGRVAVASLRTCFHAEDGFDSTSREVEVVDTRPAKDGCGITTMKVTAYGCGWFPFVQEPSPDTVLNVNGYVTTWCRCCGGNVDNDAPLQEFFRKHGHLLEKCFVENACAGSPAAEDSHGSGEGFVPLLMQCLVCTKNIRCGDTLTIPYQCLRWYTMNATRQLGGCGLQDPGYGNLSVLALPLRASLQLVTLPYSFAEGLERCWEEVEGTSSGGSEKRSSGSSSSKRKSARRVLAGVVEALMTRVDISDAALLSETIHVVEAFVATFVGRLEAWRLQKSMMMALVDIGLEVQARNVVSLGRSKHDVIVSYVGDKRRQSAGAAGGGGGWWW
jgi:hypothetical protein